MRWPWVKRRKLEWYKRVAAEATRRQRVLEDEMCVQKGAREELQAALRRSETERIDLQTALLRVSFGYPPFIDPQAQTAAQTSPTPEPLDGGRFAVVPGMTEAQVQHIYTREGAALYGGNVRLIKQHVEKRLTEHYEHRSRPNALTPDELARAAKVRDDINAAIAEGRQAAGMAN